MSMSTQDYLRAIEALHARGENITLDAIRNEAGGGSYSYIVAARRLWRARGIPPVSQAVELPETIVSAMNSLWQSACTLAETHLASERIALAASRNEHEQTSEEICRTADTLAAEVARLNAETGQLSAERDALKLELARALVERNAYQSMLQIFATKAQDGIQNPSAQVGENAPEAAESADDSLPF